MNLKCRKHSGVNRGIWEKPMLKYSTDNSIPIQKITASVFPNRLNFPWVYVNRSKLANAKVTGNEWEVKKSEIGLASQVKQTYWQLVYLTAKKESAGIPGQPVRTISEGN